MTGPKPLNKQFSGPRGVRKQFIKYRNVFFIITLQTKAYLLAGSTITSTRLIDTSIPVGACGANWCWGESQHFLQISILESAFKVI